MTVAIRKKRAMDIGEYRGQKIHHLTCLGEDKEKRMHWIVRCDCGVVRSIPRSKFGVIKTCGCQKFGSEKKREFIYHGGLNELKPKKKALNKELFYKFNVSGCEKSVEGILIQEYTNSATMYVTEAFTKADKAFVRQQGRRFVVRKKDLYIK
ncbi:hypothetical protein ACRFD4_002426 [Enterococcus faecalis]